MPWHVERRGAEHCVVKDVDGDVAGRHATHGEAVAQLRALYAAVPDATAAVTATRERDVNLPGGPGHQLRDYWVTGPGAARIGWNTPGDFTRCVAQLGSHDVRDPEGLCAEYHHRATGMWPGDKMNPGMNVNTEGLHTVRANDGDCPPGHHLMPDGTCMPDDQMPGYATYLAATTELGVTLAADPKKPYGDVPYADPGYQSDGKRRYPLDTEAHVRAAWSYVNVARNAARYSDKDLTRVRGRIERAMEKLGAAVTAAVVGEDVAVDVEVSDATTPTVAPWDGVLTAEGVESGDGRMFEAGSLTWDAPPLPLMWQKETSHGGKTDTSVRVGSVLEVWRDGSLIRGRGVIDMGNPDGAEVQRRMNGGFLKGNSVDVDAVKDANVELIYPEPDPDAGDTFGDMLTQRPELTVYHRGRIRGTTLVEYPAFTEATVFLARPASVVTACGDCGELVDETFAETGEALTAAAHTITLPDVPPAHWFGPPTDVTARGALTVTDEGRVYGYLAPLGVRHRSFPDRDVFVPFRRVDYDRFHGGETITAGGGRVTTGAVTMNCGHLPTRGRFTVTDALEHYDNTCSIVASVRVGEDDRGVWVAGSLVAGVTPEQVTRMLTSRLSGDWRPHLDRPGWHELAGALLVPVPGFPQARTASSVTVSDGALVASTVPVGYAVTTTGERVHALRVALGRDRETRVSAARRRRRSAYVTALGERVHVSHGTHDQRLSA